jgi:hypothetical protein
MPTATGIIHVDQKKGRIVLNVSDDFVRLYYWFLSREYWIRMNTPLHGAHVTIYNQKFHSTVDWNLAKKYHKQEVEFEYDEYIIEGGYTKGFLMYYMKVHSDALDGMKKELGIVDGERYRGLHLSICNGKNSSVFPDWPKLIEIRK